MMVKTKIRIEGIYSHKKVHWTGEEDRLLTEIMTKETSTGSTGRKRWNRIANMIPTKTNKQCRERWENYLRPDLIRERWSHEEDMKLLDLQRIYGNKWSTLTGFLPGRSQNSIKNRWYSLYPPIRKRQKQKLNNNKETIIQIRTRAFTNTHEDENNKKSLRYPSNNNDIPSLRMLKTEDDYYTSHHDYHYDDEVCRKKLKVEYSDDNLHFKNKTINNDGFYTEKLYLNSDEDSFCLKAIKTEYYEYDFDRC